MNKKGLAILMRTRMRPSDSTKLTLSPLTNQVNQMAQNSQPNRSSPRLSQFQGNNNLSASSNTEREFELVRESMHSAISMNKTEVLDSVLNDFSEGYSSLDHENRRRLLLLLAKEYGLNRAQVRELIKQYLELEVPSGRRMGQKFMETKMSHNKMRKTRAERKFGRLW